jgi:hypothetical protein
MKKTYSFSASVWLYPGDAAWHFVSIETKLAATIKKAHGANRRGFGSLPVSVTLGKTRWNTSIFPSKDGTYLLPLKAAVRSKEGAFQGERVKIFITIR